MVCGGVLRGHFLDAGTLGIHAAPKCSHTIGSRTDRLWPGLQGRDCRSHSGASPQPCCLSSLLPVTVTSVGRGEPLHWYQKVPDWAQRPCSHLRGSKSALPCRWLWGGLTRWSGGHVGPGKASRLQTAGSTCPWRKHISFYKYKMT